MAEIPIRRKEGRNVWPLLLGLIVLAAVLWFVVARHSTNTATAVRADSAAAASSNVTRDSAGGAIIRTDSTKPGTMTDSLKKSDASKKKAY